MKEKRRCLFCGGVCNSREHVIPEWLSKAMKIRDFAFQPAHFTEGQGLRLRPPIKCASFRTRQVCATCNNGWMSQLEVWAKKTMDNAVSPEFALSSMSQFALGETEMDLMIRWLLKTAIVFELASPRGNLEKVNPELFQVAAGTSAITDFYVWMGYIQNPNFLAHLTRGFPTWNGGKLAQYQIHSASLDFALQLNHLAVRLIRCPEATPGLKLAHIITDGRIVIRSVPLHLSSPTKFPLPHTHLFRDFYAFLDVLEVHVSPPRTESAA
jgi:hypothetical protein